MSRPAARILTAEQAADAARTLESPVEVQQFAALAEQSPAVRAFIGTPEWAAIRERIMGDGTPPLGRLNSLRELAQLLRWTADGAFSGSAVSEDKREAYLHAAAEVEAFEASLTRRRLASVPPAADAAA